MFLIQNTWYPKYLVYISLIFLLGWISSEGPHPRVMSAASLPNGRLTEMPTLAARPLSATLEGSIAPATQHIAKNGLVIFQIEVKNSGQEPAERTRVEIILPNGLLLDAPNSSDWEPKRGKLNTYQKSLGLLGAGAQKSFTLMTKVGAVQYECTEEAPMPTAPTLRLLANDLNTVEIVPEALPTPSSSTAAALLEGRIISMKENVKRGEEMPFCITIENLGSVTAKRLWVEATLSEFVTENAVVNRRLGWEPVASARTYRRAIDWLGTDTQITIPILMTVNSSGKDAPPDGTLITACVGRPRQTQQYLFPLRLLRSLPPQQRPQQKLWWIQ